MKLQQTNSLSNNMHTRNSMGQRDFYFWC